MSFDLYFCWKRPELINFETLSEWVEAQGRFTRKEAQLWYHNQDSGVYCSFDFDSDRPANEEEALELPASFHDTGLSFNLNFLRPSFFGLETMPLVMALAQQFGLSVFDPQSNNVIEMSPDHNELFDSWMEGNRNAVSGYAELESSKKLAYWPRKRSEFLWNYQNNRLDLQQSVGDNIFVPNLTLLRRANSVEPLSSFVCSVGIPVLVPPTDLVFIGRIHKSFLREKKELALVPLADLRKKLGPLLAPCTLKGTEFAVISPEVIDKADQLLGTFEFTFKKEDIENVAYDGFIDFET